MATLDDILGNGGGDSSAPKGSLEWAEQRQDASSATPAPKGNREWAERNSGDNAPVPAGAIAPSSSPKEEAAPRPSLQPASGRQVGGGEGFSYADLYKELNPYRPPTKEELAKERKKQRRNEIFAAIGDGIAALSNLYFTTQYAPNMYTGKNTMSERTRVRYDRLRKDREANSDAYANGLMKAMQADERKADADRAWRRQLGLDEYNRRRDEAKDERDRQLSDLNIRLQGHKVSAAEADANRKAIEERYAEELAKAKIGKEKAMARHYGSGGDSGKSGEYPWYDKDGNLHYARSYEAMRQNAIGNGTWNEATQSSVTEVKGGRGRTIRSSETTKPGRGHSSKPETGGKKSPTSGNGKKSPTS